MFSLYMNGVMDLVTTFLAAEQWLYLALKKSHFSMTPSLCRTLYYIIPSLLYNYGTLLKNLGYFCILPIHIIFLPSTLKFPAPFPMHVVILNLAGFSFFNVLYKYQRELLECQLLYCLQLHVHIYVLWSPFRILREV